MLIYTCDAEKFIIKFVENVSLDCVGHAQSPKRLLPKGSAYA